MLCVAFCIVMLRVVILNAFILIVVMLNVIVLSAIMLNEVAPRKNHICF